MSQLSPFALQPHLEQLYTGQAGRDAAAVQTSPDFHQWQEELRAKLICLLGLENRTPAAGPAEQTAVHQREGYREERITLADGEGVQIPLAVLVPEGQALFKTILVFHGHEPGMDYVLGHYPDEAIKQANLARDNNYAQVLAQAGYQVCVVEQRGLGQRLTAQAGNGSFPCSCRHLAFSYLMQGRTLLGERCWDGLCVIDYLQRRSDGQLDRLGCTGHSGGGTTALFLAALDARITVAVISGYFCSFQASLLAMPHCECNYVPGLLTVAEMGEIGASLAPRPQAILHGQHDPLFPVQATREQFVTVQKAYQRCGREEACALMIHPGEHVYHLPSSLAWFDRWL